MEIDKPFGDFLSVAPVLQSVPLRDGSADYIQFEIFSDNELPLKMQDPIVHIYATILYDPKASTVKY